MELRGRIALVTGAGHRVGRAIAVALGARGMRVAVHYNATADGANETVREIESAAGEARRFSGRPDADREVGAGTLIERSSRRSARSTCS